MPDDSKFKVKVAFVTGATSGLGAEIAASLVAAGFKVFGASRRGMPKDASEQCKIHYLSMDIRDETSIKAAIAEILKSEGRIDLLVANAGIGIAGSVEDTELSDIEEQLDVNFYGTVRTVKACLPSMREKRSGKILIIGSIAGRIGLPFQAFYSASKFALEGLVESLRYEVAPFGIQVCIIEPGDTKTGFTAARFKSLPSEAYASAFDTVVRIYEHDEMKGADPRGIARSVCRVASRSKLPVRVSIGPFIQRLAAFLKRILPARLFERLFALFYKIEL